MPKQRNAPIHVLFFGLPLIMTLSWTSAGCQSDESPPDKRISMHVSERSTPITQGRKVVINPTHKLSSEQIKAISERLERQGSIDMARVKVQERQQDAKQDAKQGAAQIALQSLEIDLQGSNFPDSQTAIADLRSTFTVLAEAEITIDALSTSDFEGPIDHATEELIGPEEAEIAEQIIRDRLREQGIPDDQAQISVVDDERGRQVEVRVEK